VDYVKPFENVEQYMIFSILEDKCTPPNLLLKNILETYTISTIKIRANNNTIE
jgi:hypothetical protein